MYKKLTQRQAISIPLLFSTSKSGFTTQPVSVAVPFAKGAVLSTNELWLESAAGTARACTIVATGFWPDHSIKWCVVKWVAGGDAHSRLTLKSSGHDTTSKTDSAVVIEDLQAGIRVSSGDFVYAFQRSNGKFFPDVYKGGAQLISAEDMALDFCMSGEYSLAEPTLKLVSHGPASAMLQVDAKIELPGDRHLRVAFKYEIFAGWLRTIVQVHNPHRAQHVGAVWDLGDKGSICFSEFALRVGRGKQPVFWQLNDDRPSELAPEKSMLFQASSGGQHWDSPTHVDAQGDVPNAFRGYQIVYDDATLESGDRASPQVWIGEQDDVQYGFTFRQYWQNFPKCIEIHESHIALGLFPRQHGGDYELQGGERKSHEIVFSFDQAASLGWVDDPVVISAPAEYIATTGAVRYTDDLPEYNESGECGYDQILGTAHDADNGFLAKREQIDEYGWRNFGDIYADHETLYYDDEDIFVSHYNNQYDSIYGFARQYLLTGDRRWHELLVDLARHVIDIDIYRTEEDRAEYNNGLFWHTVHYEKAYASSHRTYSRDHYPADWVGDKGGGPGSEHCYTSGLALYYQLTGDTDARDAVVGLTSWIRYYYEGTGTLLEAGKRLATDERRNALSIARGRRVFRYQYNFDRGVGNYIRALLDSYEVTLERDYIDQAEKVIQGTFGCHDDIAARNLGDIEGTWHYVVFLQEVIKYLDLKRTLDELDDAFVYARDALLHYAYWMAENEQPYLHQPEKLEFPNDTWAAQDIRRANVLYAAYRYATSDRTRLLSKARSFRDYVVNDLSKSETRHFSRIQIILLQNHGPSNFMDLEAMPYPGLDKLLSDQTPDTGCFFTPGKFVAHLFSRLGRAVVNFNPKNEVKWVRSRLG